MNLVVTLRTRIALILVAVAISVTGVLLVIGARVAEKGRVGAHAPRQRRMLGTEHPFAERNGA